MLSWALKNKKVAKPKKFKMKSKTLKKLDVSKKGSFET